LDDAAFELTGVVVQPHAAFASLGFTAIDVKPLWDNIVSRVDIDKLEEGQFIRVSALAKQQALAPSRLALEICGVLRPLPSATPKTITITRLNGDGSMDVSETGTTDKMTFCFLRPSSNNSNKKAARRAHPLEPLGTGPISVPASVVHYDATTSEVTLHLPLRPLSLTVTEARKIAVARLVLLSASSELNFVEVDPSTLPQQPPPPPIDPETWPHKMLRFPTKEVRQLAKADAPNTSSVQGRRQFCQGWLRTLKKGEKQHALSRRGQEILALFGPSANPQCVAVDANGMLVLVDNWEEHMETVRGRKGRGAGKRSGGGRGETGNNRERERERERESDRHRDRDRERETERERQGEERHTHTHTEEGEREPQRKRDSRKAIDGIHR
jgi:hypothetical protein